MEGQGSHRFRRLLTGTIVLLFGLGCGTGLLAVVGDASSLWPIADLFFDFTLLTMMVSRGPSLLTV